MAYFIACSLALESFKTPYYALRLKTSHNSLFQLNCTSKTGHEIKINWNALVWHDTLDESCLLPVTLDTPTRDARSLFVSFIFRSTLYGVELE